MIIHNFEYTLILITLLLSIIFSIFLTLITLYSSERNPDSENISTYECGFDPFESARLPFTINFFLIGIIFLLFDLEISFIFPWCFSINNNSFNNIINMSLFLSILTLGFIYEWLSGSLEWE